MFADAFSKEQLKYLIKRLLRKKWAWLTGRAEKEKHPGLETTGRRYRLWTWRARERGFYRHAVGDTVPEVMLLHRGLEVKQSSYWWISSQQGGVNLWTSLQKGHSPLFLCLSQSLTEPLLVKSIRKSGGKGAQDYTKQFPRTQRRLAGNGGWICSDGKRIPSTKCKK